MKSSLLDEDGVTRYRLAFEKGPSVRYFDIAEINAWRNFLFRLKWIGQDKKRYQGAGFGNISRRTRLSRFIVSGTQTGLLPFLTERHYATVVESRPEKNFVRANGPVPPSSESMTHAVLYACDPSIQAVIHVHAPGLWNNARKLNLAFTPAGVPYGTPEMAEAVVRLVKKGKTRRDKIFSMAGHRDGIVSFGRTAQEAGERLLKYGLKTLVRF